MAETERGGEVIKGTLDLLVLKVLQLGPMHGWGITELIEQRSENLLSVNQGSLYPALYRLVRQGLNARPYWAVSFSAGDKVTTVRVDANTGTVAAVTKEP